MVAQLREGNDPRGATSPDSLKALIFDRYITHRLPDLRPRTQAERVLSLDELRAIWAAARDGDHGVIVRLLMLTG